MKFTPSAFSGFPKPGWTKKFAAQLHSLDLGSLRTFAKVGWSPPIASSMHHCLPTPLILVLKKMVHKLWNIHPSKCTSKRKCHFWSIWKVIFDSAATWVTWIFWTRTFSANHEWNYLFGTNAHSASLVYVPCYLCAEREKPKYQCRDHLRDLLPK